MYGVGGEWWTAGFDIYLERVEGRRGKYVHCI